MNFESSAGPQQYSDSVYEVVFTPVLERPEYQGEPIHSLLLELQNKMGESDFNQYINSLISVKYNGTALWLITKSERNRTLIEGRFLPLLREVFKVAAPRIISQP